MDGHWSVVVRLDGVLLFVFLSCDLARLAQGYKVGQVSLEPRGQINGVSRFKVQTVAPVVH